MKILYYDEFFEWKNPEDLYKLSLIQQEEIKNKDKVINDLLKRISDLEFEVERLDSNNQAMQEEMARTWKKLDKAIDYVNKCSILGVNEVDTYCMDYDVKDDLLEILKGVDKE